MKKLLFILLCFPMFGFGQLDVVTKIANKDLNTYLEKIPEGHELVFGFNNREEFSQAKIGVPYEVFTLSSSFFNHEKVKRGEKYIIPTGSWRVPVIVDNEYKALLTVSKKNDVWSVVKIGAHGLAIELENFQKDNSSIDSINILRVFQLKGDFILTSLNTIYPLSSAMKGLLLESQKSYSMHDMLSLIKNKKNNYEK